MDDIVALDWDKSGKSHPAIDLWIVDPAPYYDELKRQGEAPVFSDLVLAATAGTVLAALAHDVAAKSPKRRRRYLQRMLDYVADLRMRAPQERLTR